MEIGKRPNIADIARAMFAQLNLKILSLSILKYPVVKLKAFAPV